MYRSFKVSNFRCFQDLTIPDISRINLISGANNIGKTALLEALFVHSGAYNPELTMRIDSFRGIRGVKIEFGQWADIPWISLFRGFDTEKTIEFVGDYEESGTMTLRLRVIRDPEELMKISRLISSYPAASPGERHLSLEAAHVLRFEFVKPGEDIFEYYMIFGRGWKNPLVLPIPPSLPFKLIFMPARIRPFKEDIERFGKLETNKRQDVLLRVLRVIEPRLEHLSLVKEGDLEMIKGDIGLDRLVPLQLMGEGIMRIASLTLAISDAQNGIVLLDEFENGIHHTILPKIWRVMGEASRQFNTQIFATTHSYECIVAAHHAFLESGFNDFRLHRLERKRDIISAVTYDQNTLSTSIESGLEVR